MKLDLTVRELHRAETELARELRELSTRHRAEHEIHHVARDLARWSDDHVEELRKTLGGTPDAPEAGALADPASDPGVTLLADLRHLHRTTAGVSLDWELLAQGAQATKRTDLLELAQRCHPQTLRQLTWTNAMLKALAPQILAT